MSLIPVTGEEYEKDRLGLQEAFVHPDNHTQPTSVLNDYKGRIDTSSQSLHTFLYEVMAIVNGRPLTYQRLNDPKS